MVEPSPDGTPTALPARNVLLTVQYDGADFAGWQLQPRQRTVQGVLAQAVEAMVHHPVRLWASSRTDSGVHAVGLPVCFETMRTIALDKFVCGLSTLLPDDVAVTEARQVPPGWRPRHAAVAKTYRYRVQPGVMHLPLYRRWAWCPRRGALDLDAMRHAAALMVGEHDFGAFRASHCDSRSTRRRLYAVDVSPSADGAPLINIDVTGSAFLRNMVRIMAGTLVAVGLGRRAPSDVTRALDSGRRIDAGMTAPAHGLTLVKVHFEGYPRIGKFDTDTAGQEA